MKLDIQNTDLPSELSFPLDPACSRSFSPKSAPRKPNPYRNLTLSCQIYRMLSHNYVSSLLSPLSLSQVVNIIVPSLFFLPESQILLEQLDDTLGISEGLL